MTEITLIPCPFCGNTDIEYISWLGGPECLAADASGCGATAETPELWNARALPKWTEIMDDDGWPDKFPVQVWDGDEQYTCQTKHIFKNGVVAGLFLQWRPQCGIDYPPEKDDG